MLCSFPVSDGNFLLCLSDLTQSEQSAFHSMCIWKEVFPDSLARHLKLSGTGRGCVGCPGDFTTPEPCLP